MTNTTCPVSVGCLFSSFFQIVREDMYPVFVEHGYTVLDCANAVAGQQDKTIDLQSIFFKYTMGQ